METQSSGCKIAVRPLRIRAKEVLTQGKPSFSGLSNMCSCTVIYGKFTLLMCTSPIGEVVADHPICIDYTTLFECHNDLFVVLCLFSRLWLEVLLYFLPHIGEYQFPLQKDE